jgi:hypothetical protein
MKSVFMHAWDLHGVDPVALTEELASIGLDTCSLAFSYHGGRVLLPRRPDGRVLELLPGAAYFTPQLDRYRGLRLQPHVAPEAALVPAFLRACGRVGMRVSAWTVLCHDDRLGVEHPDCCIENVFGDRYSYALCPSHPEVRRYAAALCGDIADTAGLARLELEALGFMGFEHASLHDKSGIPLNAAAKWLLSVCVCRWCRSRIGEPISAFAARAGTWLEDFLAAPAPGASAPALREELDKVLGEQLLETLLSGRRQAVATLLDEIRAETGPMHLDVRLSLDPLFVGGKSALTWEDLRGRADSATLTFFGTSLERMAAELHRLPPPERRPLPVHGGFVFHHPDCDSEADVRARVGLLREAGVSGMSFYALGLAAGPQLGWLASALAAEPDAALPASTSTTAI